MESSINLFTTKTALVFIPKVTKALFSICYWFGLKKTKSNQSLVWYQLLILAKFEEDNKSTTWTKFTDIVSVVMCKMYRWHGFVLFSQQTRDLRGSHDVETLVFNCGRHQEVDEDPELGSHLREDVSTWRLCKDSCEDFVKFESNVCKDSCEDFAKFESNVCEDSCEDFAKLESNVAFRHISSFDGNREVGDGADGRSPRDSEKPDYYQNQIHKYAWRDGPNARPPLGWPLQLTFRAVLFWASAWRHWTRPSDFSRTGEEEEAGSILPIYSYVLVVN